MDTTEHTTIPSIKEKLTIDQQIRHMKEKGILFNIVSEEEANDYLLNNNYYFRLKAYAKNFEKYNSGPNKGKYFNLEFAYLVDLAVLDMHFRSLIFSMVQDIEHYIKKQLINDLASELNEDGYTIINEVFSGEELDKISQSKIEKSACRDLILKYKEKWAVWNLVEILSLSETIKLYNYFYNKYPTYSNIKEYLSSVRYLRNATAHNNCLLNSIKRGYSYQGFNIGIYNMLCKTTLISESSAVKNEAANGEYSITKKRLKHWMMNPIINDFILMVIAYKRVVSSKGVLDYQFNELLSFINERVVRNKHYYQGNLSLITAYKFIKKFLDYLATNSI